jgi:hypothetical protein
LARRFVRAGSGVFGSAIVNAIGAIRQIVQEEADAPRRYLVIVAGSATDLGKPVQVQVP